MVLDVTSGIVDTLWPNHSRHGRPILVNNAGITRDNLLMR